MTKKQRFQKCLDRYLGCVKRSKRLIELDAPTIILESGFAFRRHCFEQMCIEDRQFYFEQEKELSKTDVKFLAAKYARLEAAK